MFATRLADPFGDGIAIPGPDTRAAWRSFPRWGKCEGCGKRRRRQAHHVVTEQTVRRHGGNIHALRNRMLVCIPCHEAHTSAFRALPFGQVPSDAVLFAAGLLGAGAAADYFERHYRCS